jgi:hypothetical protein
MDDFLVQLERKAQSEGLQFIEELVFENGAVYKGKLSQCAYSINLISLIFRISP